MHLRIESHALLEEVLREVREIIHTSEPGTVGSRVLIADLAHVVMEGGFVDFFGLVVRVSCVFCEVFVMIFGCVGKSVLKPWLKCAC